jgi:rod shape-determining protein MreD
MRWPAYFILAYIAVGLQIGLGEFLRVGGALPNLILLAVIFIALNAPRDAALLGCFGIGMIQDLVGLHPLGLYALAYAVVGMFVVSTQELVYRSHPLTHFTLALIGGMIVAAVVCIHGWLQGPPESISALLATALYSAILAPLVLGGLQLTRKAFAFSSRRRVRAF